MSEFKIAIKSLVLLIAIVSLSSCASSASKKNVDRSKVDQDVYDNYRRVDEHNLNRHIRW